MRAMAANLGAPLLLVKRLAPGLLERGYGRIVNFNSIAYAGEQGSRDYAAAKAALTRSLAMELAPSINVNCVAPGLTDTSVVSRLDAQLIEGLKNGCALKRLGRLGRPEEIPQAVLFFASEAASDITGEILPVAVGRWPRCKRAGDLSVMRR